MNIDLDCYSPAYKLIKKFECFEKDALICNCQYESIIASSIISLQNQPKTSSDVTNVPTSPKSNMILDDTEMGYWRQELTNMQKTLSWRITKPLRFIRRCINSR